MSMFPRARPILIRILMLMALAGSATSQLSGQNFPIVDENENSVAATVADTELSFLADGNDPTTIEQLRSMEKAFARVAEMAKPATVNITLDEAQGSGVVVSRDGYVLTAAHVIGRPNRPATITFADGSKANAITLGLHRAYDSGLLKITDEGKWPFLDLGESMSLDRGQWVMAVGHPGGLTEGRGLVYRVGRILNNFAGVISTDCTLVGGDSGGPLVDLDGYVIGIHSRIGGQISENFHVPIDAFSNDWDQMVDGAIVDSESAFLGIDLKTDGSTTTNEIRGVTERESAALAGMKTGDRIIKVGDDKIENGRDLLQALGKLKPHAQTVITVMRDDQELELEVTLGYK